MRKAIAILAALLLLPISVLAAGSGVGVGGGVDVEEFGTLVWQCGDRVVADDEAQPWRISGEGQTLIERNNHYLFEGETYQVDVLVMDKNKIEDIQVDLILGEDVGDDDYSINCVPATITFENCNARIDEEALTFDAETMQGYTCAITILDSEHMYGEKWMAVQATDTQSEDATSIYDEVAYWFLNPVIEVDMPGELDFSGVRPGVSKYSTLLLKNNAEGGVVLDMFIAGKDWPAADGAMGRCQNVDGDGTEIAGLVNYLPLGAFRYYAENGAFSTRNDAVKNSLYSSVVRAKDAEGYVNINQLINDGFEEAMFNDAEILQANPTTGPFVGGQMWNANLLTAGGPGMSMTFRLSLPEPCYGNFESEEDGSIFIYGEAV